jgi:hypothetical protein
MNRNGPSAQVSGVQALLDEFNGSDRCRYRVFYTSGSKRYAVSTHQTTSSLT